MSDTMIAPDQQPGYGQDERPAGRWWVKLILLLGCLLMAAMWLYYLLLAPDKGVYQLDDDTWAPQAAAVCAAAKAEMRALETTEGGFIEEPTVEQMAERARIVGEATDVLEQMVDDVMAIPVDNDRDRAILAVFEEHYRMVIADRRRYENSMANGENVRYNETVVKEAGGPVTNVITDFTAGVKGNDVPECSPPNDLINTKAPG